MTAETLITPASPDQLPADATGDTAGIQFLSHRGPGMRVCATSMTGRWLGDHPSTGALTSDGSAFLYENDDAMGRDFDAGSDSPRTIQLRTLFDNGATVERAIARSGFSQDEVEAEYDVWLEQLFAAHLALQRRNGVSDEDF